MAEKISVIIILVDLDCHKCYNKIRKILCQLQDCERIRTISFDDKNKEITIAGPFDPQRLACKLRCKGGKVIRDIHIVENGCGKPPPKMAEPPPPSPVPANNGKQKHKKNPATAEDAPPPAPAPEPEPETVHELPPPPSPAHNPPPVREMPSMPPPFLEEKPPKGKPAELDPPPMSPPPQNYEKPPMDMPMTMPAALPPPPAKDMLPPPRPLAMPCEPPPLESYVIPRVEIPSWPAPPVGPRGCPCCAPCYQGYYDGCRCYCCGSRLYEQPLPAPAGCGNRGCRTFSDEDPSAACTIM